LKEKSNHPDNYYYLLCDSPDIWPSTYEHQITVDLQRTNPEDTFFQNKENLAMLKRLLIAYTRRSQTIGYCQGFNFIAARLLKIIGNEVF
jgi:hypothetical protein